MENTNDIIPVNDPKDPAGDDADFRRRRMARGRIWVPVGFVLVGIALLLKQLNIGIPEWLFSWPMLMIVIGIFIGLAHAFRGPGWLVLILIGSFFLMDQLIPGFDLHRFLWPAIIIVVGLVMLIRPKNPNWMNDHNCGKNRHRRWQRRRERRGYPGFSNTMGDPFRGPGTGAFTESRATSSDDYIDATTVFGGIHKNILTKNFKGGDITIFMGGAEINLSQADIQGTAVLDITQIMGGTKIIVPPHWEVRSQLTSVFGNIEDKRQNIASMSSDKILILEGSSVFGGIEIRNY